jgi:hypothetical protein
MSSHLARRGPHVLAGGLLTLSLALGGCGVRLDTPPPPLPTADAAEAARQAAAVRAESIASLADDVAEPAREDLAELAANSRAHAAALGGIWAPPDWARTPAPSGTPTPSPTDAAPPTTTDVAQALADSARLTCADAVALDVAAPGLEDESGPNRPAQPDSAQPGDEPTEPAPGGAGDLVTLLASICLAQRQQTAELGEDLGDLPGRPEPSERLEAIAAALAESADAPALARTLDAAGYALEVVAARSVGPPRTTLAALAADHRALAHEVLDAAGVIGTTADPRRAAYSLEDPDALDPGAIEASVLAAWTSVVASAPPAQRAAVLAEMESTDRLARDWGAPASTFPGLPDLP